MELEDFRRDFLETVRAIASTEGNFNQSAFVSEAARRMIEAEELGDFEPCYHEGTGSRNRRLRVDGYAFDDVDGSVRLLVADFRGADYHETLTQTDGKRGFGALQSFVEDSLSGNLHTSIEESSPGYDLASELHRYRESITRYRLYLLSDATLSDRIKDWPESTIHDRPVEYHIWDIARFHRVFESAVGRDDLEVDFTEFLPDGLPCLEASQASDGYKSYLCVIPGKILAEVYDRYGSRLLEGNVRSFLSAKGKVNKNIRNSIINEPKMFFAYNNGIAATATDAIVEHSVSGLTLKRATYLQIVNGAQTTASLSATKRKEKVSLDDIHVQMKLSVVTPINAEAVIPRISYCANSQNKVSEADFFSNHPFHVRVEEHSRRIMPAPVGGAQYSTYWFYERARGQYLNEQAKLTPAQRKRFLLQYPREQVITKTDLAKYENTWRGIPHKVSLGAQKNFIIFAEWIGDRWKQSDMEFNEEYFKEVVAKTIMFKSTERLVSGQPWYQNGYRANIVTYTISKLSTMIEIHGEGMMLDMRSIWTKQSISDALETQLKIIAKEVFDVITNPDARFQNVTEWCKKEFCWERVQAITIPISEQLALELISKDEVKGVHREARARQKVDGGINAQSTVVQLGSTYWEELSAWGKTQGLLSGEQERLVNVAVRIPRSIPNNKQSIDLLKIKQRFEDEEGFRPKIADS